MRHDGRRDLPEPYKTLAWSFGRMAAVAKGTTEAIKKFSAAMKEDQAETDEPE